MDDKIACVTGATGLVGSKIVERLIEIGYKVRILTRNRHFTSTEADCFIGSLNDKDVISKFVKDAEAVFHCAAEIYDENRMWETNVNGTKTLVQHVKEANIPFFCHMSTAVVVGLTERKLVDEATPCNPRDIYEKSKLAAEIIVRELQGNCRTLILRPTEIIDDMRPGGLSLVVHHTIPDRIKVFIKGAECTHLIHVDDVAAAAIYFFLKPLNMLDCFNLSYDDEPLNTFAGTWSVYNAFKKGEPQQAATIFHLPLFVPHLMRQLKRGKVNRGDVRYSSATLFSTGFSFQVGFIGAIRKVYEYYG